MKHLIALSMILLLTVSGRDVSVPTTASAAPPTAGLGVCHFVPLPSMPAGFDWAYETSVGRGVFWRELEPEWGHYHFEELDRFVQQAGPGAWLAFQTGTADAYGVPKAPIWLQQRGAIYHKGSCMSGAGLFAPWDATYQQHLAGLLIHTGAHLQTIGAQIAGVVMQSGGMYGETQLWSCSMATHLKAYYGYSETQLREAFIRGAKTIIDIYDTAFPTYPLMLQVGWPEVDETLVAYAIERIGADRLYVKWSGLDPGSLGKDIYLSLFQQWRDAGVRVGLEPGHPSWYQTPVSSGQWDREKLANELLWAVDSGASFLCLQKQMINPVVTMLDWRQIDAMLEANAPADAGATPTPKPTETRTPMKLDCTCTCTVLAPPRVRGGLQRGLEE